MRVFMAALAAAAVATLVAVVPASATMEGHEASTVDPFFACPLTPDIFGGINYPETEPETWLARNPAVDGNLIGTFQQDRWDDGGAKGLVASWTFNDAANWGVTPLPFSKCAAPFYGGAVLPYDRASDPWDDIGPDGRAYTVSISFNSNDNNNAVGAATSTDGGVTWQNQQEIQHDVDADPTFPFNDKESVTADPVRPGVAYVVWDRLVLVNCGAAAGSHRTAIADDHPYAPEVRGSEADEPEICFEGPTFFSETLNGGVSWTPPRPIVTNSPDEQTIANQIVVDPKTDTLYNFYVYFPNREPFIPELRMIFSKDGGATWSPQQFIELLGAVGIHDPQVPDNFARTGDIIPNPAIDPNTGQLYLIWQDGRYNQNGEDDIVISTSVQGGLTGTWTVPQKVNLPEDRAGFTAAIKVNALSQVGVDYYSLRHPDLGPDVWPVERYLRISDGPALVSPPKPGETPTATFSFDTPTHVAGPFNMLMAPNAGGFFVGDYEGMAIDNDGRRFHTYFASTTCDTTNCPAVGSPTGIIPAHTSSPPDPFDVFSNKYFKNGNGK